MTTTTDHDREHAFAELLAAGRAEHGRIYPLKRDVAAFADGLLGVLFPQLSDDAARQRRTSWPRASSSPAATCGGLVAPLDRRRPTPGASSTPSREALPDIHARLVLDAEAISAGDPAAESVDEVDRRLPGLPRHRHPPDRPRDPPPRRARSCRASSPRSPTRRTGIDIHPGASIGRSFCIDHGTGVVVGETAVIGDDVKLYQGVTLGALSVAKSAAGTKRHPTIGDRVVIYANATVLGGDTVVGDDSVVGGNVLLTNSVPPDSLVYQTSQVRIRRVARRLRGRRLRHLTAAAPPEGATMNVESILATIGNTPHVRVNRLFDPRVEVWFKQERANPGGSIKDRIALAMIEDAEARGILGPGSVDHRADLRQHRHRPRARLRGQGLPPHPDDARVDVDRAPQAHDRLRRGARADAARAGHEGRDRPRQRARRRDPGRLDPDAVRQPGQPGGPPPHHGRGDPAPTSPTASTTSSPASGPAATSPASPRSSRRAGRR